MRLTGCVFYDSPAGRKRCGKDYIHRCTDRDLIKVYLCTVQSAVGGFGVNKTVFDLDICAQGSHALNMLVYRANTEVAAAGHGGLCTAEAAEHCAYQIIRCTNLAHKIKRCIGKFHITAVDLNSRFIYKLDLCAKMGEDGKQHIGVAYLRHIFNTADTVDHQRRRDYCDRCVFRSAYINFALKRLSAVNHILFHLVHLSCCDAPIRIGFVL